MGRVWSIVGFVIVCFGMMLGVVLGGIGGLYAGVTMLTGAPLHVQLTAHRIFYVVGLPAVTPFAVIGGVLAIVGVRRARSAGERRGRGLGIAGIVLAAVCLVALILGLPLLFVEPCLSLYCD